jgi:formylmethanofuran dehydrogenase subunit B
VTRTAPPAASGSDGARTCTTCPLLCADIADTPTSVTHACEAGAAAFAAARTAATVTGEAWIDAAAVARDRAIDAAAAAIVGGRRVLVTGLADATLEAILAACDLAESVGAAVDAGGPEAARLAGPTIARIGEVTAEWDELRDRADLVIFWFCDPTTTHPRFLERFVSPPTAGPKHRRTIAVGPDAVLPPGTGHDHLSLPADAEVDTARILQARLLEKPLGVTDPAASTTGDAIAAAVTAADCVAFVTRHENDPVGLRPWSAAAVVRTIAHGKPSFQVPLAGGVRGGANEKGVAAVCGWRYGAASAIARADRGGSDFRPAECDAQRLIERGDVDCIVVVGRAGPAVEAAITAQAEGIVVVRITDAAPATSTPGTMIQIRTASQFTYPHGSMLRGDGRLVRLGPTSPGGRPTGAAVVREIESRVRLRLSAGGGGDR